jgi:nucleoside-diphosphate-sugar epimerase
VRLLILGGTLFVGLHLAEAALERGHDVTLFHRGRANPTAVPQATHVLGDRERDLTLLAGEPFDWVMDTSGYVPRVVRSAVEAISAERWCFVSSVSAYADLSGPVTEATPLREPEWEREDVDALYGELKVACEEVVHDAYGDRALVLRPALIAGPHDPTTRFSYWPLRIARGGDVLAPGSPDRLVQFVDARDLAEWTLDLLEANAGGRLNATSEPLTMGTLLDLCVRVAGTNARLCWVPDALLRAESVREWEELPLWLVDPAFVGMMDVHPARVSARPLEDTIRDVLAATPADDPRPHEGRTCLSPEREARLLERLRARGT